MLHSEYGYGTDGTSGGCSWFHSFTQAQTFFIIILLSYKYNDIDKICLELI